MASHIDASTGQLTEGESWVGIDTHTCTASDAEVTFTSTTGSTDYKKNWSQYQDLILIMSVRSDRNNTDDNVYMKLEQQTDAYWGQQMYMSGTYVYDYTYASPIAHAELGSISAATMTAGYFSPFNIELFDINTGKYKSVISEWGHDTNASSTSQVGQYSSLWTDTSDGMLSVEAISRIDLWLQLGDFAAGSKFDLFGVLPRMIENTAVA